MDPIFDAILANEKTVGQLLKKSPDLVKFRMKNDYLVEAIPHWLYVGDTALHLAAAGLRTSAAKLLLENGADTNAENRRGATPLHYVCDPRPVSEELWNPENQSEIIRLLVKHGAKLDHADRGGATPLHRAVRARSSAAVNELLKAGARINVTSRKNGSTPLHLSVQSTGAGGTAGALDQQLEIIAILLRYGGDPRVRDSRGKSVLDWTTNEKVLEALQKPSKQPHQNYE